ncbi:MAG: hypothetical protein JWR44_666 [Hymenobacter sp.]|nr:hypothetical protein [Hymenobacter sp.]
MVLEKLPLMLGFPSFAVGKLRGCCGVIGLFLAACSSPDAPAPIAPKWSTDSTSVHIAAGPQYARRAAWTFWWGRHYRDIWATPVTVPVVHLATAVPGGLTPMQAGGSYQSHTLRLCAPDGREYVLRSVDKDASAALPEGWIRNLLRGLMRDQTSAALPYGAFVTAPLAEAAGVLHTNPRLVFLPHNSGLGEFDASFANALYLLEERPMGDQRAHPGFGHSPLVVNTAHMLASLRQRPSAHVAARAYLRARLLDVWLGDWSRREDQWRWASFPGAGRVVYRPIPRDRDQAFFLFDDGLLTRFVAWAVPKYHSFHATIRPGTVGGLTTTARTLDRTLLGALSAADFHQVADSLRMRLTDAAIDEALRAGPLETQGAIAARLGPLLRSRRAQLPAVAQRYYELLAREVWIVGTDQPERFIITSAGQGRVRVQQLVRRPQQPDSMVSEQVYDQKFTKQLNVYGLGGNDIFELRAPLGTGIRLGFYPGAGHDQCVVPAAAQASGLTWYPLPNATFPASYSTAMEVETDPHPDLTANAKAWMRRYNLRD